MLLKLVESGFLESGGSPSLDSNIFVSSSPPPAPCPELGWPHGSVNEEKGKQKTARLLETVYLKKSWKANPFRHYGLCSERSEVLAPSPQGALLLPQLLLTKSCGISSLRMGSLPDPSLGKRTL